MENPKPVLPKPSIEAPTISLPKGGGAIKGIGETFQPNSFSGTGGLSIPFPLTESRALTPSLSLNYDSGGGNSEFGLGFSHTIPNISIRTDKGLPRYDGEDTFILAGADHMVPMLEKTGSGWKQLNREEEVEGIRYHIQRFRPRTEGLHAKIEKWTNQQNLVSHWVVTTKENVTQIFGKSQNSCVVDPERPHHIFQWNLEESRDAKGNVVMYVYKRENTEGLRPDLNEENRNHLTNTHLHKIQYGNYFTESGDQCFAFQLLLNYGEYDLDNADLHPDKPDKVWPQRRDPFSTYRPAFEVRTHRLCRSLLLFHHFDELGPDPQLVKALKLEYDENEHLSFLKSAQLIGYQKVGDSYRTKEMPPLELSYTPFEPRENHFQSLQFEGKTLPAYSDGAQYIPLDLYSEGIDGILYTDGNTHLYFSALGEGKFAYPHVPPYMPIDKNLTNPRYSFEDVGGDARLDLVVRSEEYQGYYSMQHDQNWTGFQPFESFPLTDPLPVQENLDVNGDGLQDILLNEVDSLLCYYSQGKKGYTPGKRTRNPHGMPPPRQGSEEEMVAFTNIFGDGLSHRIRVSNGLVECWPNLGYGQFGERVLMENAPVFENRMEAARLKLADIDGSGMTDLIYLHSDRVAIYQNQGGNRFGDPIYLSLPEQFDSLDQIMFGDITGNGTTSMLFSSPTPELAHTFYDFCGGIKPYLLKQVDNNLGAVTRVKYKSSTHYYLEDKAAGNRWKTILPFPVQVIEKSETIDQISVSKLVSRFTYHHGHYDPWEREFRGFGRVDRWDTEGFEQYNAQDLSDIPFQTTEAALHAVPIYTKTWYHTGVFLRESAITSQFKHEYYQGDTEAYDFPDSSFETPLDATDLHSYHEAYRTLKGQILREEIYGLDEDRNPELVPHPYQVTENNVCLRLLQPKDQQKYAVYEVLDRETLLYRYERNPKDPRAFHTFALAFDKYGQLLKKAEVGYPRRPGNSEQAHPQQSNVICTAEVHTLINESSAYYLLGIPSESQTFEIGGLNNEKSPYLTFSVIKNHIEDALQSPISFEVPLSGAKESRILQWQRSFYWNSSQTDHMPLGQMSEQALLHHEDDAVNSLSGMEKAFELVLPQPDLEETLTSRTPDGGGYTLQDGYLWNPGLIQTYSGANTFYLPVSTQDPFGSKIEISFDSYHLLPIRVLDSLGNETRILEVDYRYILPSRIQNQNDNSSQALFDPLGRVVLTSIFGQVGENVQGDMDLDVYIEQLDAAESTLIQEPHRFIQGAGSYFFYDLLSWKDRGVPPVYINIVRENYQSELQDGQRSPLQILLGYSDGFGRDLQSKLIGEAFQKEVNGTYLLDENGEKLAGQSWLVSGRTVYNNKGNPVKQYEPFFSNEAFFEEEKALTNFGVSPVLHYDPVGRVYQKDTPKGFFSKTVFNAWETKIFDENDTVKQSFYYQLHRNDPFFDENELDALNKAEIHADTPKTQHLYTLGSPFMEIEELKSSDQNLQRLSTYRTLDIQGNVLNTTDPRLSQQFPDQHNLEGTYDMMGSVLHSKGVDNGDFWELKNVSGNLIMHWNGRGVHSRRKYDLLQRPVEIRVHKEASLDQVVEKIIYGEGSHNDKELNLRGQILKHYDQAGLIKAESYDIQGNLLTSTRQLREEFKKEVNWDDSSQEVLQQEVFPIRSKIDALGRAFQKTEADGSQVLIHFHREGWFRAQQYISPEGVEQQVVVNVSYDPKGQRRSIQYGNGVETTYQYEKETYRLLKLKSKRLSDRRLLQDIQYTYDPVGNITRVRDASHQTVIGSNQIVEPLSEYHYDSLYRLIQSSGREHPALTGQEYKYSDAFFQTQFFSLTNTQQLTSYSRKYQYDHGGNLTQMRHIASDSSRSWTRQYEISSGSTPSNRLAKLNFVADTAGTEAFLPAYDEVGNTLRLDHLREIEWNYRNNIASVVLIEREDDLSDAEYYVYDSSGKRVRKVSEKKVQAGGIERKEKIYLGGIEILRVQQIRENSSTLIEERESVHISDDISRILSIHHWKEDRRNPDRVGDHLFRFQLTNYLGSTSLEVSHAAEIVSYEEYFPYGESSFVAGQSEREISPKEYRYSGKERDEHTGLYYYGQRYYVPWLGRWMNPDPAGTVDGLNLYRFVRNNPIKLMDISGTISVGLSRTLIAGASLFGAIIGPVAGAVGGAITGASYFNSIPGKFFGGIAGGVGGLIAGAIAGILTTALSPLRAVADLALHFYKRNRRPQTGKTYPAVLYNPTQKTRIAGIKFNTGRAGAEMIAEHQGIPRSLWGTHLRPFNDTNLGDLPNPSTTSSSSVSDNQNTFNQKLILVGHGEAGGIHKLETVGNEDSQQGEREVLYGRDTTLSGEPLTGIRETLADRGLDWANVRELDMCVCYASPIASELASELKNNNHPGMVIRASENSTSPVGNFIGMGQIKEGTGRSTFGEVMHWLTFGLVSGKSIESAPAAQGGQANVNHSQKGTWHTYSF